MCINKQQTVIIGGKQRDIDDCLVPIVTALNNGGVPTVACCCGHGNRWGNVILADGRELIIAPDFESARAFDKVHGRPIHDERRALLSSELAATTGNIDYTAALREELMQFLEDESPVLFEDVDFSKLATRLNSVVKAQQNCT